MLPLDCLIMLHHGVAYDHKAAPRAKSLHYEADHSPECSGQLHCRLLAASICSADRAHSAAGVACWINYADVQSSRGEGFKRHATQAYEPSACLVQDKACCGCSTLYSLEALPCQHTCNIQLTSTFPQHLQALSSQQGYILQFNRIIFFAAAVRGITEMPDSG